VKSDQQERGDFKMEQLIPQEKERDQRSAGAHHQPDGMERLAGQTNRKRALGNMPFPTDLYSRIADSAL
jgi:hypothetical protein